MIDLRINRTIYPSLWRTIKQLILSPKAYHMPSLLIIEYLLEFQRTNSQSLHQHSYADVRCIVLYIYSSHILLFFKSDCKVTLFSRILQAKLRKRPNSSQKFVLFELFVFKIIPSQLVSSKKLMGWDFFFIYSHHFSPPSALSSHLACTFSFPNTLLRIQLRMPTEL